MNAPHWLAFTLLAFASTLPAAAQVGDYRQLKFPALRSFNLPEPRRITLRNGMVVMLLKDSELPVVKASALIRTGSRLEPADKTGLAALFGNVLRTGGTKTMTGDRVDDLLEAKAATIATDVGEDSGSASLWCLKQDFPEVLKVFVDILRNPAFSEDKIQIGKNQFRAGIARRNEDPQAILFREYARLVYGPDSPYARVPEYATIGNISRDDLVAFHRKYFRPNRMILGVVGDFETKEMARRIEAAFGDWPKGAAAKDPEPVPQAAVKPGIFYAEKEDMTQSNIIMGHLGIRRDNPDIFAVDVMNEVFGGAFASRLFNNVRSRKGLAYVVAGSVESEYDHPGTFNVWMTTKTETTAAGIDALLKEIQALVEDPPGDAEVQRAKDSILNSFIFNYDSRLEVLSQQVTYAYFGFPPDYLARYRQNIEKVTAADVARVAKKYVHRDQMTILVVGPSKGQDRPLESFGKVTRLDITIPGLKDSPAAAPEPASP